MFIFCEECWENVISVSVARMPVRTHIKKLIDGTGLLVCESSGNRLLNMQQAV
ncbi:hypothetical protein [Prevotella disiens]|uniref:hypothetical protein n=1 Tax=Prevotella disiens TaxID=28130 RepID=UPI003369EFB7